MAIYDKSWTLFLDRDGVINKRLMADYVKNTNEFELLEGVANAIAAANQIFGKVVVVTNQQGIGKKVMTERNLSDIHAYCDKLLHVAKARIDGYYFAPELAAETNVLRKPNSGMGLQAKADFPEIDFNKSVMVGDSDSDIEFGKRLGMKTVFIGEEAHKTADSTFGSLKLFIESLA